MSRAPDRPPSRCRDFVELLPWLANGSLADAERHAVLSHVDGCPACRAELDRCDAERATLRSDARAAPSPHPAQLERLFARIDADPLGSGDTESPGPVASSRPRLALLRRTPRPVRWIVAAQMVAMVGLGIVAARRGPPAAAPVRTLSSPAEAIRIGSLRAVFAPEATEAEIRAILLAAKVEIVSGPTSVGAYTLALRAGADRAAALAALRSDPRVRFAEPVVGGLESDGPTP